ncbi:DUF4157 domain-containing protein [Kibdelosporangium persicum]|uniref:eCIS core domain-containing protein n=1 Tax=Kibdelosporangium persicum TaxID=2698649 RepID=A0ABX2FDS8_9PSEU|nr:hypothetical protein [Kibdelosporangium persicum]
MIQAREAGPVAVPATVVQRQPAPDLLRLQRSAGNGAVQRLVGPAEPESAAEWLADGTETGDGRQGKDAYLAELRQAMTAAVDEALAGTGRQAADCPALAHWFTHYAGQDAAHVERAVRQYAPETATAATAKDTIPLVCSRVARGVSRWAETGEVKDVPPELLVASAGVVAQAPEQLPVQRLVDAEAPESIQARLGTGRPLGAAGTRIGDVLGVDAGEVRIHDDANAATLAASLGARAFTIGTDVAFASGQYQPGTPVGDAILAHELAHVAQQSGSTGTVPVMREATSSALEHDADRSATSVLLSMLSQAKDWAGQQAMPRLRSGLRLQRCAAGNTQQGTTIPSPAACTTPTLEQWQAGLAAARAITDVDQRGAAMTALAQQAVCTLGITVHQAGSSHPREEDPADYQATPVLNFDVRLNDKTRWRNSRRAGQGLRTNAGHNFTDGPTHYAIIGPESLKDTSPLITAQYAQHELELVARTPQEGQGPDDLELLTWTEDFRRYFHQYVATMPTNRPGWHPLLQYYDAANAATRTQSIERMTDYYNNPPVAADQVGQFRRAYRSWMRLRAGAQMITDLEAALPREPAQ